MTPIDYGLAGFALPKLYENILTPEQKQTWKQQFPIHHGAVGVLALVGGVLTNNKKLALFGLGLAIDDWKDRHEWFNNNSNFGYA